MKEIISRQYESIMHPAQTITHDPIFDKHGRLILAGWTEVITQGWTERKEITVIPEGYALVRNIDENNAEIERKLTDEEKAAMAARDAALSEYERTYGRSAMYLDAYYKYQAAVSYGEFDRVSDIDIFIKRLRKKDWSALEDVPPALKYFTDEATFEESGLIEKGQDII